jgi:DNA-binding helix-turn-helix protein
MSFGDNLKRIRNNRGMTQGDLEEKSGVRMTNISKMERNQTEPNLSTIYKLMDALDCDANSLLFDSRKISTTGVMKEAMKEAEKLDEDDQKIIIKIIEKFCELKGVDTLFKEHFLLMQTKNGRRQGMKTPPYITD